MLHQDAPPCISCLNIQYSAGFTQAQLHAGKYSKEHTPWEYLNSTQLQAVMKKMVAQLKELHMKVTEYHDDLPPMNIANFYIYRSTTYIAPKKIILTKSKTVSR